MRAKLTEEEKAQRRAVREKRQQDDEILRKTQSPRGRLSLMHHAIIKAFLNLDHVLLFGEMGHADRDAIAQARQLLIGTLEDTLAALKGQQSESFVDAEEAHEGLCDQGRNDNDTNSLA